MDRLEHMEISRRARPIIRAAAAHIIAYYQAVNNPDDRGKNPNSYISGVVRDVYSKDRDVGTLLTRAASTITSMTTATQLIETAGTSDFINILKPASAGAVVLSRGTQFDFENKAAISVPAATAAAGGASFVGEGLPIPVRQKVLSAITLSPNKFASISSFTYDIFSHSIPNLEIMVKMVLVGDVSLALDTAVLDITAADTTRPAGLRNGISGLTPSALTVKSESLIADVQQLVTAVSAVAGNSPIIFVASPAQATVLKMLPNFPFEVLSSSALAAKTVIAIAINCVVSACDPAPRFNVGTEVVLHMESTTPLAIGTTGAPNVVAAPTRSDWQSGGVSLRMIMEVSWGLRSASGLAWMVNVLW